MRNLPANEKETRMSPNSHVADGRTDPEQTGTAPQLQVPWDAVCAALPMAAVLYDAAGRSVWANRAARAAWGTDEAPSVAMLPAEQPAEQIPLLRSPSNGPSPVARALTGEVVRGERGVLVNAAGERTTVQLWAAPVYQGSTIIAAIVLWRPADDASAYADLEHSQAVTRRLVEMQEAERRRVARELHDEVGQALTAVKINLQALEQQNNDPLLAARLKDSRGRARAATGAQHLARPAAFAAGRPGLVPALRWYVDNQARRAGLTASFTATPADLRLAPPLETNCFRVAQEAITNVIRHAHATRLDVILDSTGHGVRLIVRDNGIGFNVAHALEQSMRGKSLGLSGLRERAALAGGRVDIFSKKGHGTEVRAWFPNEPDTTTGCEGSAPDRGA